MQPVHSQQSVFFVWELQWAREPPSVLHGRFSVSFVPAADERPALSLEPHTYEFRVENFFVRGERMGMREALGAEL